MCVSFHTTHLLHLFLPHFFSPHHQDSVVRRISRQAKHSSLEVLLVTGEINEVNDLNGLTANILVIIVTAPGTSLVNDIPL